tara:strand:+ start:645 stop:3083 length:2439 start_codon:yes stop_codon:yes gene_type:complete
MTDRQIQHELEMSRAATDAVRRDVQTAKEKGYFSSTDFARHFLQIFALDFGKAIYEATRKPARGKATTTNIAIAYGTIQEVLSRVHEDVIAVISIKSIFDSFGVCKFDIPRTAEAASFIGRRIEDEVRVQYYAQSTTEDVVAAQRKELNTPGSNPHFRRYGAKKVVETLLVEKGWSNDFLFPDWSLEQRIRVGLFILEVAKQQGYVSVVTKQVRKNKKQAFINLSPEVEAQFRKYQARIENYSVKPWPLIEPPHDWVLLEGPSRYNFSGGYHSEWIRKQFRLCRSFQSNTEFAKESIDLLNKLNRTAWNIDSDIYQIAHDALMKGMSIGSLNAVNRDPRLDQEMPEHIKLLQPNDPERKDWKKERRDLHAAFAESRKKSVRSREALLLANRFQVQPRFYLSWSCDYRGRMYSQQSLLHIQSSDVERSLVTFADGCKLDDGGEQAAAQALGSSFIGDKVAHEERATWTYDNKELLKAIADDPIRMCSQWELADEPWQFLQLCLEWNRVVLTKEKTLWDVPIGADSTASGLQLLSAMRRDPKGMEFTNLFAPESKNEPPRDAYKEVLRIARQIAYRDPETAWISDHLEDRALGKPILMKAIYGASQQTNRADIKSYFIKQGLFPKTIDYQAILTITKILRTASKHVFPMAFASLDWINKLFVQAKSNGNESMRWTTPNNDIIDLIEYEIDSIDIRTSHLGKVRIGTGQTDTVDYASMKKALAPSFVHSYDAAVLKSSFKDWDKPIALIHDCLKVLPNDMENAKENIRKGFNYVCSGDPLSKLADDLAVSPQQLPRLKQGSGDLLAVLDSIYMFN